MGGGSAESARRSLRRGASPWTLAVADGGKERKLAAKDRAAAKASSAGHRRASADVTAARVATGAARARDRASSLTNSAACGDHRALARSANRKDAPAVMPLSRRGIPAAVRGKTRVVSTASCKPPHKGRPLAMTSMRLLSGKGQH